MVPWRNRGGFCDPGAPGIALDRRVRRACAVHSLVAAAAMAKASLGRRVDDARRTAAADALGGSQLEHPSRSAVPRASVQPDGRRNSPPGILCLDKDVALALPRRVSGYLETGNR